MRVSCVPRVLQEVSLLADLRAVVARALSGLDMFSEADGKLSPTVSGSIGGAGESRYRQLSRSSLHVCVCLMLCCQCCPKSTPAEPKCHRCSALLFAAAGQLQGASSVTSVVPRKQTLREGLYTGLQGQALVGAPRALLTCLAVFLALTAC